MILHGVMWQLSVPKPNTFPWYRAQSWWDCRLLAYYFLQSRWLASQLASRFIRSLSLAKFQERTQNTWELCFDGKHLSW